MSASIEFGSLNLKPRKSSEADVRDRTARPGPGTEAAPGPAGPAASSESQPRTVFGRELSAASPDRARIDSETGSDCSAGAPATSHLRARQAGPEA